jgi:hypothetical protein
MFAKLKNILLTKSIRAQKRYAAGGKQFYSFDTARKVGVLFLMEQSALPKDVHNFLEYLKRKRLPYFALGYYDQKENPNNFISTNRMSVFNKSNMNWFGKPICDSVESFLQQNYDIVIDLCRKKVLPLGYVAQCANVATLIGGHFYDGCPYDIIVDAQQTCDMAGYIEQVKYYLSIISHPQNNDNQ